MALEEWDCNSQKNLKEDGKTKRLKYTVAHKACICNDATFPNNQVQLCAAVWVLYYDYIPAQEHASKSFLWCN